MNDCWLKYSCLSMRFNLSRVPFNPALLYESPRPHEQVGAPFLTMTSNSPAPPEAIGIRSSGIGIVATLALLQRAELDKQEEDTIATMLKEDQENKLLKGLFLKDAVKSTFRRPEMGSIESINIDAI